jgi:Domain of unknown function (DUF929)
MIELTQRSQALIDEPPVPRPTLDELRARTHRRQWRQRALAVSAAVIFVVAALGALSLTRSPSIPTLPATELTSYFEAAVNVSNATLESVGLPSTVVTPDRVTPSISTVATNGVVSYVGAEYCPYCALQRWALLVALSKFGTFTHLDTRIFSSSSDVYPHLASWSFYGATYKSKYFAFDPTELTSSEPSKNGVGGYQRLQKMSVAQSTAFHRYNASGEIPFVDMGNRFVTLGASASPSVLSGLTLNQIGSSLNNPESPVAQSIDGSANYLIGALCTMVQKSPPTFCSSGDIRAAVSALNTGVSSSTGTSDANTYPTQPPTDAPLSVWKRWSSADRKFMLRAAATFRPSNPACTVLKISVTGQKLSKPLMGIPAGVWTWALSMTGHCAPGESGGLAERS